MKSLIVSLLSEALQKLIASTDLDDGQMPSIHVEHTKDKSHGDFASNVAMQLTKRLRRNPREIAQQLIDLLPESDSVERVEIAGPGFINFFLLKAQQHSVINSILQQQTQYGLSDEGAGQRLQVEFVSANPTGPLHVGHGRGAAYGDTVANLLEAVGYDIDREYYVNDAGRQMDILATSVWLRYLELSKVDFPFPSNGYKGEYVIEISRSLFEVHADRFVCSAEDLLAGIPDDEQLGEDGQLQGDKEAHIDALIQRARDTLSEHYALFFDAALNSILGDIRQDLSEFGVEYAQWFSERSLSTNSEDNQITVAISELEEAGHIYEKDGAKWFKSSALGDDKDRVVIRDNGQHTYFAADIAYHRNKFKRGYDGVVNVWGSDHHGYIPRVKAALKALDEDAERLKVRLVQFVSLFRNGEAVPMTTRGGQFVTLRDLRKEVGNDAARFFYVSRKCEQHIDFDLELAKTQSKENPIYYIQYAHARVSSVLRKLTESGEQWSADIVGDSLQRLTLDPEHDLVSLLSRYPDTVLKAALQYEPHSLVEYLKTLAREFHGYYDSKTYDTKVLCEDVELRNARLALSVATQQVIANGLALLGVSAPDRM